MENKIPGFSELRCARNIINYMGNKVFIILYMKEYYNTVNNLLHLIKNKIKEAFEVSSDNYEEICEKSINYKDANNEIDYEKYILYDLKDCSSYIRHLIETIYWFTNHRSIILVEYDDNIKNDIEALKNNINEVGIINFV